MAGLEVSDVVVVDGTLGETRWVRFDFVATVRAVRPLKIESSSCSLSADRDVKISVRSGWSPLK